MTKNDLVAWAVARRKSLEDEALGYQSNSYWCGFLYGKAQGITEAVLNAQKVKEP